MAEVNKDAFYATDGDGYIKMVPPFSSLCLCVCAIACQGRFFSSNVDTDFKLQGFSFLRSKDCSFVHVFPLQVRQQQQKTVRQRPCS